MTQQTKQDLRTIHRPLWERAYSTPEQEPFYQCAGVQFGSECLIDIHFRDDSPEYLPATMLHYDELTEEDGEAPVSGFFCREHLQALGQEPRGPTLAQVQSHQTRHRFSLAHAHGTSPRDATSPGP